MKRAGAGVVQPRTRLKFTQGMANLCDKKVALAIALIKLFRCEAISKNLPMAKADLG